jgi:hypothetical protein
MGTSVGIPFLSNGETRPSADSAADRPLSVKVRVGDEAEPVSATASVPSPVTVVLSGVLPRIVTIPSSREIVAWPGAPGGSVTVPFGLAIALPANDQRRA